MGDRNRQFVPTTKNNSSHVMNISKGKKLLIAAVLGVLIYLAMVLIFKYFVAPNLTDV